ncbi:MAG: formylmethanofuran dehydrogenase subunit C [Promethearchaeota archaeon]
MPKAGSKVVLHSEIEPEDLIPINASVLTPDAIVGKSIEKIRKIKLWHGNRQVPLGKLFRAGFSAGLDMGGPALDIHGPIPTVRRLGENMTRGKIIVHGDVGMHCGARMKGGLIRVEGNADHWLGAEMSGGQILVEGSVGDKAASAYLGSKYGMNGGSLHIKGNAGHELGMGMRRGVIVVEGDTDSFTGTRMLAGTIFVRGKLGSRAGASMRYKGSIITIGHVTELLPTHVYNGEYQSMLFLRLLFDAIEGEIAGIKFTEKEREGPYHRFTGDFAAGGQGELLFLSENNRSLGG